MKGLVSPYISHMTSVSNIRCGFANLREVLASIENADVSGVILGLLARLAAERVEQIIRKHMLNIGHYWAPRGWYMRDLGHAKGIFTSLSHTPGTARLVVIIEWEYARNTYPEVSSVLTGLSSGRISFEYLVPEEDLYNYEKYPIAGISWKQLG